jgi:hypothetical protein
MEDLTWSLLIPSWAREWMINPGYDSYHQDPEQGWSILVTTHTLRIRSKDDLSWSLLLPSGSRAWMIYPGHYYYRQDPEHGVSILVTTQTISIRSMEDYPTAYAWSFSILLIFINFLPVIYQLSTALPSAQLDRAGLAWFVCHTFIIFWFSV